MYHVQWISAPPDALGFGGRGGAVPVRSAIFPRVFAQHALPRLMDCFLFRYDFVGVKGIGQGVCQLMYIIFGLASMNIPQL